MSQLQSVEKPEFTRKTGRIYRRVSLVSRQVAWARVSVAAIGVQSRAP